jgi:hypothetical protein
MRRTGEMRKRGMFRFRHEVQGSALMTGGCWYNSNGKVGGSRMQEHVITIDSNQDSS